MKDLAKERTVGRIGRLATSNYDGRRKQRVECYYITCTPDENGLGFVLVGMVAAIMLTKCNVVPQAQGTSITYAGPVKRVQLALFDIDLLETEDAGPVL